MGWKDSAKRVAAAAARGAARVIKTDTFARVASSLAASATSSALVKGGDPGARRVFLQALSAGFDRGRDPTDVFEKTLSQHIEEAERQAHFDHVRYERFAKDQGRMMAETRGYISEAVSNIVDASAREEKLVELLMREQHSRAKALDVRLEHLQKALYEIDKEADNDTKAIRDILMDEAKKLRERHSDDLRRAKLEKSNLEESIAIESSIAAASGIPWVGGPITAAAHATHFGMELLQAKSHLDHVAHSKVVVPAFRPYDYNVRADIQAGITALEGDIAGEEAKNLAAARLMVSKVRQATEKFQRFARAHEERANFVGHAAAVKVASQYIQIMRSEDQAVFIPVYGEEPLCAVTVSGVVTVIDPPLKGHIARWENVEGVPTSLSRKQMLNLVSRLRNWPIHADPKTLRKVVFTMLKDGPPRMVASTAIATPNEEDELTRV